MEDLGDGGGKCLVEYQYGGIKSNPPPFLMKTYLLVDDPSIDDVISWNPNGTAFVVWKPDEFSRDLLPTFFKHNNFSSFIRQLNTYGFRKVTTSRWEFYNDMFLKGKRELLCQISRRKARANCRKRRPTTSSSSTKEAASPSSEGEDQDTRSCSTSSSFERKSILSDENKRLKRENGMLSSELCCMKRKFKELLDLVAMYTRSAPLADAGGRMRAGEVKCCDSNDDNDDDRRPKLFGVRLGGKEDHEERKRNLEI